MTRSFKVVTNRVGCLSIRNEWHVVDGDSGWHGDSFTPDMEALVAQLNFRLGHMGTWAMVGESNQLVLENRDDK